MGVSRKPSKLSKLDDEHYLDGMSPPSSNEGDSLPNLTHLNGPHQNFQSRFPPATYGSVMYERDDDEDDDMDAEHDVDDDMLRHHTETVSALFFLQQHRSAADSIQETEDEEYGHFGIQHPLHPYHQNNPYLHQQNTKPRAPRKSSTKRKRQSTLDSTGSSGTFSSAGSRWDELIEAATTRAVVESVLPPSPPQTAQTLPSICPNTPTSSESSEPKLECGDCRSLAPMHKSYVCTECVAGFCEDCALSAGKRGVCTECRAFGVKFKPLKIVVRTA